MPTGSRLLALFSSLIRRHRIIRVFPELRVPVRENNFLVPDVTVFDRSLPVQQIVTQPPIAVFEVLSPEDRILRTRQKLAAYAAMGIPQIWIIIPGKTPDATTFEQYQDGVLRPASRFDHNPIVFDLPEVAAYLQA
jgi:Uma2 family endonuclease